MVHEVRSNIGISKVFDMWKKDSNSSIENRIKFYLRTLIPVIADLEINVDIAIKGVPIIISGMGSSTVGMMELPYTNIPIHLDDDNIVTELIPEDDEFPHSVLLISGIRTSDDVMRGEEVQLLGMGKVLRDIDEKNLLVILPGTHSKHVEIKSGMITDFSTYITGELFALMSQNGLLKEAVKASRISEDSIHWAHFIDGVKYSGDFSLLQGLFKVRTNDLFQKNNKEENYYFLSGLLIGYELRSIYPKQDGKIVLCCQNGLFDYYKKAVEILGMIQYIYLTPPEDVDTFTILGQLKLFEKELRNQV